VFSIVAELRSLMDWMDDIAGEKTHHYHHYESPPTLFD
jgi:hypothetical protein